MKIYNVLWKDRHTDTTATPFLDKDKAISWAKKMAKDSCSHIEDLIEEQIDGWLYYVRYSCEDDCLWVTEHIVI